MMPPTLMESGEPWFGSFPTESRFRDTDVNAPLLVDVGGGLGHDIAAFHAKFPALPGKLILQDLPAVIENIKRLTQEIKRMKYDFSTPRLVKGTRAYYMRQILYDWLDKEALAILGNICEGRLI